MTATPVLARRTLVRLAFIIAIGSVLVAFANRARADESAALFFVQTAHRHPADIRLGFPARHPRAAFSRLVSGQPMRASFYGGGPRRYEPNSHTASGERFNQWAMTAAHRSLPFGTRLRVAYGSRSVVVRVNDRGPARWTGRSLDLSRGAARALGFPGTGTVYVASAS